MQSKRPGGKLTDKQRAFLARVQAAGALGIVVCGVDDLRAKLRAEGYPL